MQATHAMQNVDIEVDSPNTRYSPEHIEADYKYAYNLVEKKGRNIKISPKTLNYTFRTKRKVNKTGLLLVGWGGNNGCTVTGGILANKNNISW